MQIVNALDINNNYLIINTFVSFFNHPYMVLAYMTRERKATILRSRHKTLFNVTISSTQLSAITKLITFDK